MSVHVAVDVSHCRAHKHRVLAVVRVSVVVMVSTTAWQLRARLNITTVSIMLLTGESIGGVLISLRL